MVLDFGALQVSGGRLPHRDLVDSPYSLFISSSAHPDILADITFRGGPFTYETRWVRLNTRSEAGYPDRGANYKVFAVRLGDWRFGLQDSAVYVDRVFDEEYFFSPVPNIVTQMINNHAGKPWGQDSNDNSILGLFVERQRPESYLYAQWLVDDIDLSFLVPPFLRDEFPGTERSPRRWPGRSGEAGSSRSAGWASTTPAPPSTPSRPFFRTFPTATPTTPTWTTS